MVQPLCHFFGTCGGCSAQHLDYQIQLNNKKNALISAINFDDVKVFSGKEYGYRNRIDLVFFDNGVGFRKKEGNGIIDVDKCVICNDKINELLTEIRSFFTRPDFFDVRKKSGTFRYAVVRTASSGSSISFVLNEDSMRLGKAVDLINEFVKKTSADNVVVTYLPKDVDDSISEEFYAAKGTDVLKESFLGKDFSFSIQGFFQNNPEMAEKMHEYVNNIIKSYEVNKFNLLDLYAGVGTFGIINADLFKKVFIVESFKQCVDAAKLNIEYNEVTNAEAIVLNAKYLKKLSLPKPLFMITDPPRSGMDLKTIEQINILKPEVIIYISCNFMQLAKELPKLKDYRIKSVALFDLFPQTYHSESVIELTLNKYAS